MRTLRLIFLAVLGIALLAVASANRTPVTLRLLPEEMDNFLGFGWAMDVPLFLVIFTGIVAGLGIGFVWEWLREAKIRAAASQHRREAGRLKQEVSRLRAENATPQDEVLALLEGNSSPR
ncbi:MAG: LapA family protein [Paracoccaceae bacterium]|nr:LapA family protein [Paracoccaceae bacterium]MDH5530756.1 LapA family protein [Paracoccaceae bacterium]